MQIFVTSGIDPNILINILEDWIMFLIYAAWILVFMLKKNKGFHSGSLLKMSRLSPSMEKFVLDIPE